MKIIATECPNCFNILYSRAQHDFRTCGCGNTSVDGGQLKARVLYKDKPPKSIEIDVDVTEQQLYDDWNNRKDKYGIVFV